MEVKTNILLSVIVGGYPVIEDPKDYRKWEQEYTDFRKCLPVYDGVRMTPKELADANTLIRTEAIYNNCPEMKKLSGYLECAKNVIQKYYKSHSELDEEYFEYCKNFIKIAEDTTGDFHYYPVSGSEFGG